MKRIAIIAPCNLPVPATKGGAVEGLITRIIDDNEISNEFHIDLFTVTDDALGEKYDNTSIIPVRYSKLVKLADRVLDKFYRTFSKLSFQRFLDSAIADLFYSRIQSKEGTYDFVIVENMMSTAVSILGRCRGSYDFPMYFHMHNDVDIYRSSSYIKELVRNGVYFIAVSEYIKRQIIKHDKNAVVSTLYNGVDLTKCNRTSKKEQDKTAFLYMGRIIPEKGVKELAEAFLKLERNLSKNDREQIRLDIYGFSSANKHYEKKVLNAVRGIDNITCHKQVPSSEVAGLYANADVVVMPTISEEPFGLVALETMAMGKTLITTDSGALSEVVGDGAYVINKEGDIISSLCDAMYKLYVDKSFCHELAARGYERAHTLKAFDLQNYYHNLMAIIDPQMAEDERISIIVPVYNVSEYIERCLLSITRQTYKNLEIIIVDDESTDDSGKICDEYAALDSRIKVIHQENQGLSGARNTGLDLASGQYIFFCDSDDYLREDALEILHNKMIVDHADIVACGISKAYDAASGDTMSEETFTDNKSGRWGGKESIIQMMRSNNVCSVAWNKLYKRKLFEGIRFPLGVFNEDEATVYKLLYKAGIVSYIPDTLYKYYQRQESIIHEDLEERYQFFLQAISDRIGYFKSLNESELEQHSRISFLEWIKYSYRNIEDNGIRKVLAENYSDNISFGNVPTVMGTGKALALLLWKFVKY